MIWRLAGSLIKLRDQVNQAYPARSKVSDGTIGDAAHAREISDHNPNPEGVVCALDITHDPAHGLDIDRLSDALADSRDPRIKYLIANNQILVPADYGWTWQPYSGVDPHTSHLHVSVYGDYDNTNDWNIGGEKMSSLSTFRIASYHILGNNGQWGAPNALNGDCDQDYYKRWNIVPDGEMMEVMYVSDQAKQFRHNIEYTLPAAMDALKAKPGDAAKQLADLKQQLKKLVSQ